MAGENSDGSEQLCMPLPSLPRIPVASSSRARLAHRRPISISLPSKLPPSSSSQSGGEKSETWKSCLGQLPSTNSVESFSAPALLSSLPALAASRLLAAESDGSLAPICEQPNASAACSSAPLSLLELNRNVSVSSVSDDSVRITGSSANPFDDSSNVSNIEIGPFSLTDDSETQTSSQSSEPKLLRTDGATFCEHKFSVAQSPTLQVQMAELNKNLGLDSEESEPEEGQLPGQWSGSEDSSEEKTQNSDKKLEDCRIGKGLTVPQIVKLSQIQFRVGNNSPLPSSSTTSDLAGRTSWKSETAEKKRKKHKKGEGAKKRAREKSAQKYKERKKQKLKPNAVEQPGESPVARLARGEQPESQNAKRNSVENATYVPKSRRNINSKEVVEEGEIPQPIQTSTGLLSSLVEAEVGLWTTDDIDDQLVAQMEEDVAVKKKRGPQTAERILKRKIAKRKKRAKKEKESGVRKRHPRNTVSNPPVKVLCTHFMKGRCSKGENCPFSHDAVPLTKQEPCKFLMTHSCLKGDDCPFSHDLKAFPCKFFHTRGLCYDGDKCLFSHGPITEEEREKLLKRVEKDKERGSITSVFDLPTPDFSSSLPAEEDPDPLGWGTANACPSFDVDLQQRSPGAMNATPTYSVEAEYGNLPETFYLERSNWEISPYSTVDVAEDGQIHSADHHTNKHNTSEELDYVDMQCRSLQQTTRSATTPDTGDGNVPSPATEISAVSLAAPTLPTQGGSLFVKRKLEPEKSGPWLSQTTGSRKLTVESLLGEVLKH